MPRSKSPKSPPDDAGAAIPAKVAKKGGPTAFPVSSAQLGSAADVEAWIENAAHRGHARQPGRGGRSRGRRGGARGAREAAGRGRRAARDARRLPLLRRRRHRAVRRQGAQPQAPRRELLPEGSRRHAHRPHDRPHRAARDDGGAHRGRGAAAREQPDQDVEPEVQHPVPRRQELPVPAPGLAPVPARGLLPRRRRPQAQVLRAVSGRVGRQGDDPADPEGVPACAPARTPSSPTARGPACCTRSSAARGRAWGWCPRPTTRATSATPSASCWATTRR